VLAIACSGGGQGGPTATPSGPPDDIFVVPFPTTTSALAALPVGYRVDVLLDGLLQPAALSAPPDGRIFIAEQTTGRVRVFQDGRLLEEPWAEIDVGLAPEEFLQELGLVGLAVDPRFAENGYVYLYYSQRQPDGSGRVVFARLRDENGHGVEPAELFTLEALPERSHISGGIAFDGDDAILVSIGDFETPGEASLLASPFGAVIRIDRDGNAPPDNPFVNDLQTDPRIFAYGLRNPFGVAVDRVTGEKYITENRDVAGDAVYRLEAGMGYGWPEYRVALREPLAIYQQPMGLSGITVYRGDALPELQGSVFFCHFHRGGGLHWMDTGVL